MSGSVYQESILQAGFHFGSIPKKYRVTISNRGLKLEHLLEYLNLELDGYKPPKNDLNTSKTVGELYILELPVKLTGRQIMDINLLRTSEEDAQCFLEDLREEKQALGLKLQSVAE